MQQVEGEKNAKVQGCPRESRIHFNVVDEIFEITQGSLYLACCRVLRVKLKCTSPRSQKMQRRDRTK